MNSPTDQPRVFTVEEANRMLPLVSAIVHDIMSLTRDLQERRARWDLFERAGNEDPYVDEIRDMKRSLEEKLRRCVEELEELHVELKDPLQGLVDFRSKIDGREIYLCWQYGEEELEHWHPLDAGFSARQPLYETTLAADKFEAPRNGDSQL